MNYSQKENDSENKTKNYSKFDKNFIDRFAHKA